MIIIKNAKFLSHKVKGLKVENRKYFFISLWTFDIRRYDFFYKAELSNTPHQT